MSEERRQALLVHGWEGEVAQGVEISVLVYRTPGDVWIAQGVEYDIVARAKNLASLPKAFSRAVASNLHVNAELGRSGLDGIPPAPDTFKLAYDNSTIEISERGSTVQYEIGMRMAEAA